MTLYVLIDELDQLKKEAYKELQSQIDSYSNNFISHMRRIEKGHQEKDDDQVQELVELFRTGGSIKDYSTLVEWELCKQPTTYFDNHGECGDLW
ncbi:hypothetical protein CU097_009076 [Rhizopus azygosporus]|uniref:Uncharacterized protein n=1 Tax=Rhizopus azygosporus TaxID=86630 RepID=A0A367J867_RHIAZ|nr:hypothetical protein CU097_009076 [Rhizopus azygosporus]